MTGEGELDIVVRLDRLAAWWLPGGPYQTKPMPNKYDAAVDARDEIVRLRAEVASLRLTLGGSPPAGQAAPEPIGCPCPGACMTVAEVARLREALAFYADAGKYPAPLTGGLGALYFDCGTVARAALAGKAAP